MPDDDERARAFNSTRLNQCDAVENGAHVTNAQLLSGFPHAYLSPQRCCQLWIATVREDLEAIRPGPERLRAALTSLHLRFDGPRLAKVIKLAEADGLADIAQRAYIYAAFTGGVPGARMRVAAMALALVKPDTFEAPFFLATAVGLVTSQRADSMAACRTAGFQALEKIAGVTALLKQASKSPEPVVSDLDDDEEDTFLQSVSEDRAEFFGSGTTGDPLRIRKKQQRPGAVVVPKFVPPSPVGRDDRGRVRKDFADLAGKRLPFVLTGDVADHLKALVARAPHLGEIYAEMLLDTAMSMHVRMRPWLLVGEPGCGKSEAARDFADVLRLPVLVFDAGASSDGAFAGTPAQWSSAGASKVMQHINATGVANPLVVVDEVDKAANSPANGSLHNALLSFLDPGSAAAIHDPGLEMPVDLSQVNYILTANDLGGVPAPLRDRCRIVRVPNPSMEHVPAIVKRIVDDLARQRNIDPRWEPPFPPDEVEIIAEVWGGGSIRRLRQVVQSALNFRTHHMGRC